MCKNFHLLIKASYNLVISQQASIEVEDFSRSRPDAIAHSAAKIIARVKSGGDKTTQALKSLCWRCKGIQVEVMLLLFSLNIVQSSRCFQMKTILCTRFYTILLVLVSDIVANCVIMTGGGSYWRGLPWI